MKTIAAFVCLVFATTLTLAQGAPAAKPVDSKAAPAAPAIEKPADSKAAPAAKKEVKKEAPLPKIPGMVLTRPNGDFLSLEVVGGNFRLTFYNKKHKPMAMDVSRANARWSNPKKAGDDRTVLNGSGSVLVGSKPVVPPYVFNIYLTLLVGEGDQAKAVENYTVAFRG
jgi:hypothetical protein